MFDTILPADTVEFCPHPAAQDIFVCGTYNLIQTEETVRTSPQKRNGQCLIFKCHYDDDDIGQSSDKIQEIDYPALPDMKWYRSSSAASKATLCVADSEGEIHLLDWNLEESRLEETTRKQIAGSSETLCLSLDWSNRRTPTSDLGKLVVSCSDGDLVLLDPTPSSLVTLEKWTAHDYEPWIAAWNYWDTNTVYSGGDDFKLKGWDIRTDLHQPIFVNKRLAGITTIQSHPYIEHLFAVGSYDSSVRLFDIRKPIIPLCETNVGGGAWRVKWHPSAIRKSDLLVACMHDGFKTLRFDELREEKTHLEELSPSKSASVVQQFDEHQSLAYGVDWSFAPPSSDGRTAIASCSFYDHSLHFWSG
ncbi:WD40-repeat-containing domain protein [Lentinula raphanica]|uniref:methylated diphthine methylhydrolase n=1 Tax=Lentinula raphanica TaxID=153919 RepID=A0AA38P346_9AGAR|nr:WD40-repeat-containing domain protein [Lentinula raphanica]KAJ3835430.1 WD40-repeat-containing domain protein [Lentinula raphanica]